MTEMLARIQNSKYKVVPLCELLDNLTDGTHYTPTYTEKGIKFISVTNITENEIDFENTKYISEKEHHELVRRCNPEPNSILLTKIGSIGRAAVIPKICPPFSIFVSVALLKTNEKIIPNYLCAYLNSRLALRQFERHLKGIGVPDLHLENIAQTQIIVPSIEEQMRLASRYIDSFANRKKKLNTANDLIAKFEYDVTSLFNLKGKEPDRLCFAVYLKDLDGVIDAKRYASMTANTSEFKISDVCNIVDEKVNVSRFEKQIIDWIRIDDLPNQPLDIEKPRTQSANKVEGTFFEVQEGDILVARLGPTILNQKIVMVRSVERTTIASAEFLVLRCKEGYNPESVMAVLKTAYYRDLMYSHARGSTPSRYRLNREDMLKLPFPDIREHQDKIANDTNNVREQVKAMRIQAEQEWQEARKRFEKELLGE